MSGLRVRGKLAEARVTRSAASRTGTLGTGTLATGALGTGTLGTGTLGTGTLGTGTLWTGTTVPRGLIARGLAMGPLAMVMAMAVAGARAQAPAVPGEAVPAPDPASPPAGADPRTTFERAEAAERAGDVRAALAGYHAVVNAAPTSRYALRAERRLAWLEPRATDPEALGALLLFRARGGRTIEDVERLRGLLDATPTGPLRAELLMTIASELDAMAAATPDPERTGQAEEAYRQALEDASAGGAERAQLVAAYATLLGREGRTGEALLLLDAEGHERGSIRSRLELQRVDAWARPLSWSVLSLLALLTAWLVGHAIRAGHAQALFERRAWLLPASAIAYVLLGPYLLGLWYSTEAGHLARELVTFLAAPLVAAAVIGRCRDVAPVRPALGRAAQLVAAASPFAAGYLAIYGVGDGPLTH